MRTETGYKEAEIRRIRRLRDRELTVACLFLCALLFLILGILPITPGGITRFYRPAFIFIAAFSLYRYYPLQSSRWQLMLGLYYFIIYICRQITGHSTETFISHELFIAFFILAAGRRWSRREINLILDTVIFSCGVQAAVVLISNSFLLHAGSQQHIHYLWISTNRNPIAFAIVPGAVASLLKLIYCSKGWKTDLLRGYWIFSFLLCTYDVFAIGCRSAFYSLGLGMACIVWERVKRTRNPAEKIIQELIIITMVLVGITLLMRIASGAYSSRLFTLEDSGRKDIWDRAMELIREKPLFGGGYDYWEEAGYRIGTHNTFITFLLEGGAVAAAIAVFHLVFLALEVLGSGSLIPFAFMVETVLHMMTESGMDYYAYLPLIFCIMLANYSRYQGSMWELFNGTERR